MKKKSILFVFLIIGIAMTANSSVAASSTVLMGMYPGGSLQTASIMEELNSMNDWLISNGASEVSIAGDFMSLTLNPGWNVEHELSGAWDNGFIPFVNLMPSSPWEADYGYYDSNCDSSEDIAQGYCNGHIATWADHFKEWAGNNKMAYIAPLPEANGDWASHSTNGSTYKQAYYQIQSVFAARGVPDSAVKWVFAPNGWHDSKDYDWRKFENYYPGDNYVDVVGFSSYNYGGCPAQWAQWSTYEDIFEPYLLRMTAMAPSKPIFITQTGTVGRPVDDNDPTQTKNEWLRTVFSDLADYPNLKGIIYFNIAKAEGLPNCPLTDFRVFDLDVQPPIKKLGLLDALSDPRFGYFVFADVQPADPPLQNVWYYDAVHTIYDLGITTGCSSSPLMYCPDNSVTRGEMAVFLLKSMDINPPDIDGSHPFSDITGHWAEAYIEELYDQGITRGYTDGTYRPNSTVTRAEMAVFLLKSMEINVDTNNYVPAHPFSDITGYWAEAYIEELYNQGITNGYPDRTYRPLNLVSRAEMAVFLVKTFDLQ